jgi:hypothetical protein
MSGLCVFEFCKRCLICKWISYSIEWLKKDKGNAEILLTIIGCLLVFDMLTKVY